MHGSSDPRLHPTWFFSLNREYAFHSLILNFLSEQIMAEKGTPTTNSNGENRTFSEGQSGTSQLTVQTHGINAAKGSVPLASPSAAPPKNHPGLGSPPPGMSSPPGVAPGQPGYMSPGNPNDPVHDLPLELLQAGWRKFWSKREGRPYFFNKVTNQSLWEMPVLRQVWIKFW